MINPVYDNDILVVGLARNCSDQLRNDIAKLQHALSCFRNVQWLIIESDSEDESLNTLDSLTREVDGFSYISLGALREELPGRTERIAFCRNIYLREIRNNKIYKNVAYVIVADFDGINSKITQDAILSCWEFDHWDVCAANQCGPYYDVWALRHED